MDFSVEEGDLVVGYDQWISKLWEAVLIAVDEQWISV